MGAACSPVKENEVRIIAESFRGYWKNRNKAFWLLGCSTGCRVSEILSLTRGDLISETGELYSEIVINAISRKGGKCNYSLRMSEMTRRNISLIVKKLRPGKSGKVRVSAEMILDFGTNNSRSKSYTVYLTDGTKSALKTWLKEQADMGFSHGKRPVFCKSTGEAISRFETYKIIKNALHIAKIDSRHKANHTMRKTCGVLGYEKFCLAGFKDPLRMVKELLGHRSISSTESYMNPIISEDIGNAVQGFKF